MVEKIKLAEVDGWPGKNVKYLAKYSNGEVREGLCSLKEWQVYEISCKLIKLGVDEKMIKELYDLAYNIGSEEERICSED